MSTNFADIETITVSDPEDPHGMPVFDGEAQAVTAFLLDGTYPAVAYVADEDVVGTLTIDGGEPTFTGKD